MTIYWFLRKKVLSQLSNDLDSKWQSTPFAEQSSYTNCPIVSPREVPCAGKIGSPDKV